MVWVEDTTPPEITLLGDNPMWLEVGAPYEEPGYTATDVCEGDLTSGVWDVEATGVPSQGESTTWSDSDTSSACKFYRIVEIE